jgi:hypothetical protein
VTVWLSVVVKILERVFPRHGMISSLFSYVCNAERGEY